MSVVKLVTLHVNVAYGLVLEAWVVEDAAAEVRDTAAVAAAAAQDIGGAQATVEGATVRGIVPQRGEATAGHRRRLVREVTAGHRLLLVSEATAGPRHSHPSVRSPLMLITRERLVPKCWKC